ncbi:ferm domain (protein4.1-ezrin-radixin-moesin) family [Holotrichia oblita]|uniref:Ferm domain (Protein4.1-ezrin-radixin-moesin) family n=1 Tax=Holotrichia oblita TaxID=644536 RepID=A0ACB9SQ84_HOLOL|nr:ferm domain (protein4.1-ezrin-radixin-moesin) family [Holotrichia oblita]
MMHFDEFINEEHQNKENENPAFNHANNFRNHNALVLDSSCLSGLPNHHNVCDKRRGVKMGIRAFSNNGRRVSRSMEAVNVLAGEDLEQLSLQSVSINYSSSSTPQSPTNESKKSTEAYIISSSIKSDNNFLPDLQESLSRSLIDKLNNFSFDDERILQMVTVVKDPKGSLGMQITEGSDGKVYVQSVIQNGPAYNTGNVYSGDQIIAVDGRNLLQMKYKEALDVLKNTGPAVNFVLSQFVVSANKDNVGNKSKAISSKSSGLQKTMNKLKHIRSRPAAAAALLTQSHDYLLPRSLENLSVTDGGALEKHLTENCYDVSNLRKYNPIFYRYQDNEEENVVPYHKHIRYEIETDIDESPIFSNNALYDNSRIGRRTRNAECLNRTFSKSCTQIYVSKRDNRNDDNDRAVIVDMIPKKLHGKAPSCHSLDRKLLCRDGQDDLDDVSLNRTVNRESSSCNSNPIALPRSLGLSRKWRGPVRYPVTPVKKTPELNDNPNVYVTTSDEEQVFI